VRIIRLSARDMTEAVRRLKQELGPEAVILSTRKLPEGGVELTAALEPEQDEGPCSPGAGLGELEQRIDALARRLEGQLAVAEALEGFALRPEVGPVWAALRAQELSPVVIYRLLEGLSGQGLWARVLIRLRKMLKIHPGPTPQGQGPVVWALVGPTGVGKTTTIAKLAARLGLSLGVRVGMVSVDAYRIAAAEQLVTYGRIMEIPTLTASSPAEYADVMQRMSDRDVVLVDTVGRSPADPRGITELKQILQAWPGTTCHLVIACPTREADQRRIAEAFGILSPHSLIFTKLDETAVFGPIINRVVETGLGVSFVTTGQRVPEDLEEADAGTLARLMLPTRGQQAVAAAGSW